MKLISTATAPRPKTANPWRLALIAGLLSLTATALTGPAALAAGGKSSTDTPTATVPVTPGLDPAPPTAPVKLVLVQPAGDTWLANVDGGLGPALRDNNYYVSSTNETWGPDPTFKIGSETDIGQWWEWFRGPDSDTYLAALYAESGKNLGGGGNYSRMAGDPGGDNEIVVIKSDAQNSALGGVPTDPVPPIDSNPLRGQSDQSEFHTLANAKGIYLDLLNYFQLHPEKLFIVVTAGPLTQDSTAPEEAANARALNTWLVDDWLKSYPYSNVAVFDFYNVLTSINNHHRYLAGGIDYTFDQGDNYYSPNYLDVTLHFPDRPGLEKATAEFVPLLNVVYNRWRRAGAAAKPTPTPVSVPAAPGQWANPTIFPDIGWFPDIAVDSHGSIHLVWSGSISRNGLSYDEVLHSASPDGRQWSAVSDIMAMESQGEVTRPALLPDPRGLLYLTFRLPYTFYSQAPAAEAADSTVWQTPQQMNFDDWAYFSRAALDSQGHLHLIYTQNLVTSACSLCYHLYYRESDDGRNFTQPVDISQLPTGVAKPQILMDDQNNIFVVWEAGRGGSLGHVTDPAQVVFAASYDDGKTWSAPVIFSSPHAHATDSQRNITLGRDGQGHLVVAWLSVPEDLVYFEVSSDRGRTWSAPKAVPGIWGGRAVYPSDLDDYSMATDSSGVVHMVLAGRTFMQRSLSVLHIAWNGSAWSQPDRIITFRGDVPEWPRLAIGGGNHLYVTWFVRDQAEIWSGGGDYRIWFTQSLSAAPPATPVVWPTMTATAVPDVTPTPIPAALTPTPTETAVPAAAFTAAPAGPAVYSEQQYLILLAETLLPVLAVLGAVVAAVLLVRRPRS